MSFGYILYTAKYLLYSRFRIMLASMAPVSLDTRAAENLQYIRDTMQRASTFTAVPGGGGILMGMSAIAASLLATHQESFSGWLMVWIAEAVIAFFIGGVAILRKARRSGEDLSSKPARKFALGFAPPMFLGAVVTIALWRIEAIALIPGVWLSLYGVAVIGGGASSVRVVPGMGFSFLVLGCIALLVPNLGTMAMICGFGFLHILFGIVIARRYGG